jgi:rubredoxin
MAENPTEKPGKKHQHGTPIKIGDKFVCPKCKVELPANADCPHCKISMDWSKV